MDYSQVHTLLVAIRDAAGSCLKTKGVPFCAYIWAGADSPISCDNGLSISVMVDTSAKGTKCDFVEGLEITIAVDQCGGNVETAEEADEFSCHFYEKLVMVSNGLFDWLGTYQGLPCTSIQVEGFRYSRTSEEGCVRYISRWKMNTQ